MRYPSPARDNASKLGSWSLSWPCMLLVRRRPEQFVVLHRNGVDGLIGRVRPPSLPVQVSLFGLGELAGRLEERDQSPPTQLRRRAEEPGALGRLGPS